MAEICVESDGEKVGKMIWNIYYSRIVGDHFQKILPVILPAINQKSMENLSHLIGGTSVTIIN